MDTAYKPYKKSADSNMGNKPVQYPRYVVATLRLLFVSFSLLHLASQAQPTESLPGEIPLGQSDSHYFVCNVSSVNEDESTYLMGGGHRNFWTQAMKGGKFEAIDYRQVRVASGSAEGAKDELYQFYQRYAKLVFARGPRFDKGTHAVGFIVQSCAPEPGRTSVMTAGASVPAASFRRMSSDRDHQLLFIRLAPKLSDEQTVRVVTKQEFTQDAFKRKDEIGALAASLRSEATAPASANIVLDGKVFVQPFNLESNVFVLPEIRRSVHEYGYLRASNRDGLGVLPPAYDLLVDRSFGTYRPLSENEARKVERLRAAGHGELPIKTYVIPSGAVLNDGKPTIKGSVEYVDVLEPSGALLFRLSRRQ